jgi:penicillin-binding protein 1A
VLDVALLQEPEIEGALLAMDNHSGAVLAMVGGYDFERSEFNRAVQSKLQCGSAFKPFVFLTAFENGYTPADTLFDAPFLLPDGEGELTYCPKNYYDIYYGITTLRKALEMSYNASTVKLQDMVGGRAVVEVAKAMGISTELHPYPSLALGTLGVRLIDLVKAYAGFANLGEVPQPYFVAEVRDRDGKQLERFYPVLERKASPAATYLLLHVLEGVVQQGTAQAARSLGVHTAGKTGTTDDHSDAWYIGSTPRITVGVWVGRDQKAPIGKKMSGAVAALPIWIRFMQSYFETLDEAALAERFPVPAGVVFSPVDRDTGHVVVPACADTSRVVLEAFLDGTEPTVTCEGDDPTLHDMPWPFQAPHYSPRDGEAMPTPEAVLCADVRLLPKDDDEEEGEEEKTDEEVWQEIEAAGWWVRPPEPPAEQRPSEDPGSAGLGRP